MNSDSKKYDAFLSHSSKDRAYAELVCQALESHSLRCWIAPRDILPGAEWGAAIIDGIDQSSVMLLIFSQNANESAQVRREVERAISKSLPILPYRIEETIPEGSLEFALSNTHWLDGFTKPIEPTLSQLVQSVKALCNVSNKTNSSDSIDPMASKPNPNVNEHDSGPKTKLHREAAEPSQNVAPLVPNKPFWSRRSFQILAASLCAALVCLSVGMTMIPGTSETVPIDEEQQTNAPKKPSSGLSKTDFQKREMKRFAGRWIAVHESTPEGGKLLPRMVQDRAFSILFRPQLVIHRRNPKQTQTVTIRGQIAFSEGAEYDSFIFRGIDQNGQKQSFVGIYEFDGELWHWCFRMSIDHNNSAPTAPLRMNTNGERTTHYVAMKSITGKDD